MKSGSLSIRKESIPYGTQPIPVSIPYIMKIQWSIPETDYDVDNRGSSALAHPFFLRSLRIQFFKCNDRPDSQRGERGRWQKPLHCMWKDSDTSGVDPMYQFPVSAGQMQRVRGTDPCT